MTKLQRWIALVLAVAALPFATAQAGEPKGHKPPPKPVYTAIASVDTGGMTITTETKNAPSVVTKTYKITPKTVITVSNHPATLADLKPGLQVRVGQGMDAGTADEISAQNPPPELKAK